MAEWKYEATVDCLDGQQRRVASIHIVQPDKRTPAIRILTPEEAREFGEERVQLSEGRSYDFELLSSVPDLSVESSSVVKPNSLRPAIGRIDAGVETGLLQIQIRKSKSETAVALAAVEILSVKINYRDDYRGMLGFIADQCSELLFDVSVATQMRLTPRFRPEPKNLQRQFEFLNSELTSRKFTAALSRILSMPHQRLATTHSPIPVSAIRRSGRDVVRQIARSPNRLRLPAQNALSASMAALGISNPSVPRVITVSKRIESLDTPENRFVKYALCHFQDFLRQFERTIRNSFNAGEAKRIVRSIQHLNEQLAAILSADLFRNLPPPTILPLGSPVLQRKGGYREVLQAWLKFDLASELVWHGGDDVYSAGKRDMAVLYEYWAFFQLLRLFRDKFRLPAPAAHALFERKKEKIGLKLKTDEPLGIEGACIRDSRQLQVRFHYNLTHDKSDTRAEAGSWTRRMRPDFTLSFWPMEFSLNEAEAQELSVHIHFDAKYRVESIAELFGDDDEDLVQEKARQKRGDYKRADLLKMHAYRDAIRRSEGA